MLEDPPIITEEDLILEGRISTLEDSHEVALDNSRVNSLFLGEATTTPSSSRTSTTHNDNSHSHLNNNKPEVGSPIFNNKTPSTSRPTLRDTRRWDNTRGSPPIILPVLEIQNPPSLAVSSNSGGISNPVEFDTTPMEISSHEIEDIGRPTSSGRSSIEIPGCGNHREIAFSEQGVSVKFLHNSRRNQKTSDFRLQSIEQVCTMSSLQNGRYPSFEINLGERRFYLQDRPEGRICSSSTSSSLQTIFNFFTSWYGLPIQNTGIWPQCSPPNFFKTNALCSGIIETERHPTSILPGRHLLSNETQKRNAEEFERNSQALDESWILNQHQEEQLGTTQSTRIPRVSIRYIKDVNQTTTTKTEENS
ncbi:hypothetical protein G6F37_011614 [Rhizopus arrhizus]|nr:hypothetical protein G6F37_011614 [Rhizopus arrhizus]